MKNEHKNYPLEGVVQEANNRLNDARARGHHAYVHQKWTCRHCGARQTMEEANAFHRSGRCEECNHISMIDKCNYVLIIEGSR